MVMLSDFLRFRVQGPSGRWTGLKDVIVDLSAGDYPPVTRLVFRTPKGPTELPWEAVSGVDWRKRRVRLDARGHGRAAPDEALRHSVLLKRDVMDALVLDVGKLEVMRANDLWLREEDGRLWLRAADISPWAVLRRLGRGLLGRGGDRHLVDWRDVEFLRGDPTMARSGHDYHRRVERLQPGQIAALLDALPYLHATELLTLLPDPLAARTLEEMSPARQLQVFLDLEEGQAQRLLELMVPERATELLNGLGLEEQVHWLERLSPWARERINGDDAFTVATQLV